jgi:putative ABC transport system permease protein
MRQVRGVLAWRTAWKIAWRDLRASWGRFIFVVIAVALGVGSLTGIRSFSLVFRQTLLGQARTILAADLSARDVHPFTDAQLAAFDRLRAQGVEHTLVTETVSMASTATRPDPLLVSLKAVDPTQYPYYGTVQLASGRSLRSVLNANNAVVSEEFLLRMHAHVGDKLHLGNSDFQIADVIRSEPDRISSIFNMGPRVMIAQVALPATGLIRPGSRASERMLFRLLPATSGQPQPMNIDTLRHAVETILPEAQIADYREANPALAEGLRHATAMLTLVSLVTLVLSAIGVAMAMHAHLRQRLESIAIMKALGARSAQIIRIYVVQTLFLGMAGGLLGVLAGSAVARVLPLWLRHLVTIPIQGHLAAAPVVTGLLTGILTTLLFTLPPLLEIRNFRPLQVFRRPVEPQLRHGWRRFIPADRLQSVTGIAILLGLAAIAGALTESAMVGGWFTAGLAVAMLALFAAAQGMLALLRRILRGQRQRRMPMLHQGLVNLQRPGNQTAAVLAALGVGVMLLMTIYSVQHAIVRDLNGPGSVDAPNVYLVDISTEELPDLMKLTASQPAVHGGIETIPIVSARIAEVNGTPAEQLKIPHYPQRMLRSTALTWSDAPPVGEKVVAGKWWPKDEVNSAPQVAVNEDTAKLLRLKIGSKIAFAIEDRRIKATVTALYRTDGEHIYSRSRYILPPDLLAREPVTWYAGFQADPARVGDVERALFAAYPTVSVISVADVMSTIHKVVDQIALLIRFLAGSTMLAGAIILISSIAATRFQRVREIAILKSLGALRRQILAMLGIEFAVLGGIAGVVGVAFALMLSWVLLRQLQVSFHPGWAANVAAVAATALLASGTGWLASLRILQQKPLQILRDE